MLITFEGIDGSGKSTQIKLLKDYLSDKGKEVLHLREPGSSKVSERIRGILLDKNLSMSPYAELFLFEAARAELVEKTIIPELEKGKIILLDRFYDSTTAYQGFGRGLNLGQIKTCNETASRGVSPDLTFFLDIDFSTSRKRHTGKEKDRMELSGKRFYERVSKGYRQIAEWEPERFFIVNAQRGVEEIFGRIVSVVEKKL